MLNYTNKGGVDGEKLACFYPRMVDGAKIIVGGLTVVTLFAAQIWLIGRLNDWMDIRAKTKEAANPGQANARAERIIRRLGIGLLLAVKALSWSAGLMIFPAIVLIVYVGA